MEGMPTAAAQAGRDGWEVSAQGVGKFNGRLEYCNANKRKKNRPPVRHNTGAVHQSAGRRRFFLHAAGFMPQ